MISFFKMLQTLCGHFFLSLPDFFQRRTEIFLDIPLSCSPNCSKHFFTKFIHNCIVL